MKKYFWFFLLSILMSSCVSHESLITFYETDLPTLPEDIANHREVTIQPEDLLRINVHSYNLEGC